MKEITDGVFIETEYLGCNIGCVVTEKGPVLIDAPTLPHEVSDLRNELRRLSPLDIAYLVYTHGHFDHLIGGAHLTGRTIAHRGAADEIAYLKENLPAEVSRYVPDIYQQYKEAFDNAEIALPQVVFDRELKLCMGDRTLVLFYAGGHSADSLAVYLPEERVLFAGDNIVSGMPLVTPNSLFGEWIDFLHRVEVMEVDIIAPGHGPVCGMETVTNTRLYFAAMRDRVSSLIGAGATREEVVSETDLTACLPVPTDETVRQQVASTVAAMYEQVMKGTLGV
ncbi:MAG TPA: MBL fold metallo-hydrolase [Dehalococcoidales bacterium]|nr:MBL fold metallo-hydrolase [Dehalococcoidales bacterium]